MIEATLAETLGVEAIVWLPYGLALDADTDGHVDNVAAFIEPGRLLLQGCDDPAEDDQRRTAINRRCAQGATDASGRELEVVEVPVLPYTEVDGRKLMVPYLNLYVLNGAVIVPTCGHPADDEVLDLIGSCYPGREVVAVPAHDARLRRRRPPLHHPTGPGHACLIASDARRASERGRAREGAVAPLVHRSIRLRRRPIMNWASPDDDKLRGEPKVRRGLRRARPAPSERCRPGVARACRSAGSHRAARGSGGRRR